MVELCGGIGPYPVAVIPVQPFLSPHPQIPPAVLKQGIGNIGRKADFGIDMFEPNRVGYVLC
jgi:hypothetical protein